MKRLASLGMLLVLFLMASAHAQNPAQMPRDVDPESKNRLPLIDPKNMDEGTRKVFLELAGNNIARHSRNQRGTHRRDAERFKCFFCLDLRCGRLRNLFKSEHHTLDPITQ